MFEVGNKCGQGRPKGSTNKYSVADLRKAFDKAEEAKGISILDHLAIKAYDNPILAVALLKKMLPDLRQVEAIIEHRDNEWAELTPAEIVEKMTKRTIGDKTSG